jgi:ribosomal protein S7
MQHRRQDSFKRTQRHKIEMKFMTSFWNQLMCAGHTVDKNLVTEAMKIIFNHYLPNPKQV